jgi:hypothetical protein
MLLIVAAVGAECAVPSGNVMKLCWTKWHTQHRRVFNKTILPAIVIRVQCEFQVKSESRKNKAVQQQIE